jgi:hypothetical protein
MEPIVADPPGVSHRTTLLLSGAIVVAAFLASISYAAGFVGNFLVPKSVDWPRTAPLHREGGVLQDDRPKYADCTCLATTIVS